LLLDESAREKINAALFDNKNSGFSKPLNLIFVYSFFFNFSHKILDNAGK